MSDTTTNLQMPYILAAQAQKHVTHNEALRLLDGLVHLSVRGAARTAPPRIYLYSRAAGSRLRPFQLRIRRRSGPSYPSPDPTTTVVLAAATYRTSVAGLITQGVPGVLWDPVGAPSRTPLRPRRSRNPQQ